MTPELAELLERIAASRGYITEVDAFKAAGLLPDLVRQLAEAEARMDALERLAVENPGGLLIHHQVGSVKWTGVGLGLSSRSLRKAIDQAAKPHACPKCGKPGCGCAGRAEGGAS